MKLRCKELSLQPNRDMKVIFVQGKSGTGKTYYSKKLLDSLGYDYAISSSSNDIFQDYLGQRAILLDDMRDNAFKFYDLLKILDNNTKSSCYSRFSNKPIDCKMVVITSSIPLRYWYKELRYGGEEESLYQLYRRINSYVVVTETEISIYDSIDEKGNPVNRISVYKNELVDLKKVKEKEKFDLSAIFDKFAKKVETNIVTENYVLTEIVDDIF